MKTRLLESARTTFAIIGAAGYAGEVSSMNWFFRIISVALTAGILYGIYTYTEVV